MQIYLNISIWPIDRTLIGTTTQSKNEPGSNDNEGVIHSPQFSRIVEDFVAVYSIFVRFPSTFRRSVLLVGL